MKKGFSLVELIIVTAVLGILAAMALPALQGYVTEARSAAAKDNLRVLREAIERYASEHNSAPPGYILPQTLEVPNAIFFELQLTFSSNANGDTDTPGTNPDCNLGPYVSKIPDNPFNSENTVTALANDGTFPAEASGSGGWIYQPFTKTIRLNWPGTDKEGVRYYDY